MANDIQQECPFVNYRTDGVGYCSYYRRVCRLEESEHDCFVIPLLKIGIADIITDVFHNTYSGPRGDDDPSMDFKQAARQIIRYYLEEVDPAKAEDLEYSLLPDYLHPKSTIVKEHAERLGIPVIDIPLSGVAMHEILHSFLSYRVPKTTPRWRRICNRILRRKELSYPKPKTWDIACDLATKGLLDNGSLNTEEWSRLAADGMSADELYRRIRKNFPCETGHKCRDSYCPSFSQGVESKD